MKPVSHFAAGVQSASCFRRLTIAWFAGTTWDSTFGKIASSYEECRAECSGLYLCLEEEVLKVFGHDETAAEGSVTDVTYINWLLMARAGLTGLEFYTPETKGWRQAHMQVRSNYQLLGRYPIKLPTAGALPDKTINCWGVTR